VSPADTFKKVNRILAKDIRRGILSINELVASFAGPIDLLSLDLDGNDYWIWKALDVISPRVVIAEFNPGWGPERAATMSYNPGYRLDFSNRPYRCGASLPAFVKLGKKKGYRLVGTHSLIFNAFFVKDGIGEDLLPAFGDDQALRRQAIEDFA
jgi:hypothetical protein